ncbi:hypothetical protein SMICM17S_08557 [Streptomyces microflavus]
MLSFEPVASLIVPPTVEKTPIASITIHRTAAATTVQMPRAIDSRKLTFITDHGSALATRRRALRVRGVVRAPVRGLRVAWAPPTPCAPPSVPPPWVPPAGDGYA